MKSITRTIAARIGDPPAVLRLAEKRVRSLVNHHWHTQGSFNVNNLAQSCYMQGMDDAFESLREKGISLPLPSQIEQFTPSNYEH